MCFSGCFQKYVIVQLSRENMISLMTEMMNTTYLNHLVNKYLYTYLLHVGSKFQFMFVKAIISFEAVFRGLQSK